MKKKRFLSLLVGITTVGISVGAGSAVVVVVNPTSPVETLSKKEIKDLWLGKKKRISGYRLRVIDQEPRNETNKDFYATVIKKKPRQLKAYWAKKVFSGKTFPPKQLADDDEVKEWLGEHLNGLGYIDSESVDESVKVLYRIDKGYSEGKR